MRLSSGLVSLTLVATAVMATPWTVPPAGASPAGAAAGLDRRVPALLRRYHTPGAAVAVIDHGAVVWSSGYGVADRTTGTPVGPDTVFEVGSISKTVTAWGVLRLADEGRINLDAPVGPYLTGWQPPASRFDPRGVTVRRLLSHTAGLSVQGYAGSPAGTPLPTLQQALAGEGAPPVRLIDAPGSRFHYSGGGYAVLQLLVEEVSGQPFADYMRDNVLLPLGMTSSGYALTPDLAAHAAVPYSVGAHRVATRVFTEQGAEGLYTTANDFARFLAAETAGGRGVLAPGTVALSRQPAANTAYAGALGRRSTYGLGVFLESVAGTALAYHPGVVKGWAGMYALQPDRGAGVVVLTNSDTGVQVSGELACLWAGSVAGGTPQYCRSLARAGTSAVAGSGGLAAGMLAYLGWVGWELATGRRRVLVRPARRPGKLAGALVAVTVATLWFVIWHTDLIPSHAFGDEIAPASLLPSTFLWTSFTFVGACVAVALARFTARTVDRPLSPAQVRLRVAVPVLTAAAWTVAWATDLGTRLVLNSSDLIPARALPSWRWLTWAVPAACALWGACRIPTRGPQHA